MAYNQSIEELAKDLSIMFHGHNFNLACIYMDYGMRGNINIEDTLNLVFDICYKHNAGDNKCIHIEKIDGCTKAKCLEKAILEKFADRFNTTDIKEITYNNSNISSLS